MPLTSPLKMFRDGIVGALSQYYVLRLVGFVFICALASCRIVIAGSQLQRTEYSFRRMSPVPNALELFGPNADRAVRLTEQGLRIDIPTGSGRNGAVGISPRFCLSGDFEIVVKYELLYADRPQNGLGSGVKVWLELDSLSKDTATLAHVTSASVGDRIVTMHGPKAEGDNTKRAKSSRKQTGKERPTTARKGTLKIERKGSQLAFSVSEAESGEFVEVDKCKLSGADVKSVRISANTGGADTKLGICISDIVLAANRQSGASSPERRKPFFLMLGCGATCTIAIYLIWRHVRRTSGRIGSKE